MNQTDKWSISLPMPLSRQADAVAAHESRTRSELIREALRHYLKDGERVDLTESPRLSAVGIIRQMASTGLYPREFLKELKASLEYADQANQ